MNNDIHFTTMFYDIQLQTTVVFYSCMQPHGLHCSNDRQHYVSLITPFLYLMFFFYFSFGFCLFCFNSSYNNTNDYIFRLFFFFCYHKADICLGAARPDVETLSGASLFIQVVTSHFKPYEAHSSESLRRANKMIPLCRNRCVSRQKRIPTSCIQARPGVPWHQLAAKH